MNTTMKLGNPDDLEATITISGTVREFRRLKGLLSDGTLFAWPLSTIATQIDEVIGSAEIAFGSDAGDKPE